MHIATAFLAGLDGYTPLVGQIMDLIFYHFSIFHCDIGADDVENDDGLADALLWYQADIVLYIVGAVQGSPAAHQEVYTPIRRHNSKIAR